MLKKGLYLYAMMIFCFTALQATDELPTDLDQTIVKGKCPHCPRHNTQSSDEDTNFVVVVEDDNAELDNEAGNLFSVVIEDENNPHALSNVLACKGKNRKYRRNRAKIIDNQDTKNQIFVCNDEENEQDQEVVILPVTA